MSLPRRMSWLLCAASLAAWAAASMAQEPALQKYTDPQGRFAVGHPEGWTVELKETGNVVLVAQQDPGGARVLLSLPRPLGAGTAKELAGQLATLIVKDPTTIEPDGEGEQVSQDPDVYRQRYKVKQGQLEARAVLTVLRQNDGKGMFSYYHAPVERFEELQPLLVQIVSSFWIPDAGEAAPPETATALQFQDYTDPDGEFTGSVPKGWIVTKLPGRTVVVSEDKSQTVCALATSRRQGNKQPAKDCAAEFIKQLSKLAENVAPAEQGVQVSQTPDIFVQTVKLTRGKILCAGHLTVQCYEDGTVQYYYYQADAERFLELEPVLCRILSSLKGKREEEGAR